MEPLQLNAALFTIVGSYFRLRVAAVLSPAMLRSGVPKPLPSEGEYRHEQRHQQQDGLAAVPRDPRWRIGVNHRLQQRRGGA